MPFTSAPPPPVKKTAPRSVKESSVLNERTDALNGIAQIVQLPLIAIHWYADVGALTIHWPNVAREVATLAESQEKIAALIDPLIRIGPYTALIAAGLPLVMQVAVNHGTMPAGAMGTVPATALAAQVETAMAQQELESLRLQMEAEKAAAVMRSEIEKSRRAMAEAMRPQS